MIVPDTSIDTMLTSVRGTTVHVCSAEPANYAGIAAVELASGTFTGGDYSLGNGAVDGRTQTLAGQADLNITGNGDANSYVVSDGASTLLLAADISNPQTLTSGGTVSVASLLHTIRDAA